MSGKPAGEQKNHSYGALWRLVGEKFHDYAPRYAIAFVFMALVAATTSLSAWIIRDVVNELFVNKDFSMVKWISLAVMLIFLVKGVSAYFQSVLLARIGNSLVADQQRMMFRRVLQHGTEFFAAFPSSDLVTRMTYTANAVRDVLNMLATSIGRDLLSVIGLTVVMFLQQPVLSLVALMIAPPAIWGVGRLIRRVRKVARAELQSMAHLVANMQETVLGIKVIKAFTLEEEVSRRMGKAIANVEFRNNKIATIAARASPLMETLGGFAIAGVIFYAGWLVTSTDRTPGEFISFLFALMLAYEPAKRLAKLNVELETGLIGVGMMYEMIDRPIALTDHADAKALATQKNDIELQNVTFSYKDDIPVLAGISLTADSGRVTALVGASGGGKSTIMGLILRFFDPNSGAVCIGGEDISLATTASVRSRISFVGQDTFLFSGTVLENILMGRLDASREEVEKAAKAAFAHEFILELSDGYDTMIGENGASLSGGQRQRIAIARAFLKDAPILLMDEATSALDNESEAKVKRAMARLARGRTTLIIAHRLTTVRNASKIYVITAGSAVEEGDHETLMARRGVYHSLHTFGILDSDDEASGDNDEKRATLI